LLFIGVVYKNVGSSAPNLNWVKAWLAKHKIGNRLPRGKAFNLHRHLESKADSQALGKLIIGSIKTALNFGELENENQDHFIYFGYGDID
jgi:hypothetical protein